MTHNHSVNTTLKLIRRYLLNVDCSTFSIRRETLKFGERSTPVNKMVAGWLFSKLQKNAERKHIIKMEVNRSPSMKDKPENSIDIQVRIYLWQTEK